MGGGEEAGGAHQVDAVEQHALAQQRGEGGAAQQGGGVVLEVAEIEAGEARRLGADVGLEDRGAPVCAARHAAAREHLVEAALHQVHHFLGVVGGLAAGDDPEGRHAGRGGQRIGVEGPRMRHHLVTVPVRVRPGLEHPHDVPFPHHGAAVQPAGHHLGQRRHVRRDAEILLRAAHRVAKARHHLIENQHHAAARRLGPQMGQEGRVGGHRVVVRAARLGDHRGDVVRGVQRRVQGLGVVERHQDDGVLHRLRDAGRQRHVERLHDAAGHVVVPAVKMPLELDDLALAGRRPRCAQRQQGRLGAGAGELHRLGARHHVHDELRPLDLAPRAAAGVRAPGRLLPDRLDHRRVGVPQQHGAVAGPEVDVAVAVHVPLVRPDAAVDVDRKRLKRPRHVRDAAGQVRRRLAVQLLRLRKARRVFLLNRHIVLAAGRHGLSP